MTDTAPYALTKPQNLIPEGVIFPMVLCTTADRLQEILNAIKIAEIYTENSIDSKIDILEALAFLDEPQTAPCYPPSDCDEDTQADSFTEFVDGILTNIRTGGISKAIGYVIEEYGEVIFETALKIVGVTVVGYLTGGLVNILVGGTNVGQVIIGASETVEILLELPDAPSNIIQLIYEVAA